MDLRSGFDRSPFKEMVFADLFEFLESYDYSSSNLRNLMELEFLFLPSERIYFFVEVDLGRLAGWDCFCDPWDFRCDFVYVNQLFDGALR